MNYLFIMKRRLLIIVSLLLFGVGGLLFALINPFSLAGKQDRLIAISPDYTIAAIAVTADTLRFALPEGVLPKNASLNYQALNGRQYLSLTDQVSQTVNIYDFETRQLCYSVHIPKRDQDRYSIDKITSWFKSFDSIFISIPCRLYQVDTSGTILATIDMGSRDRVVKTATLLFNSTPAIFKGNDIVYLPVYPNLDYTKREHLRQWPIFCKINFNTGLDTFLYHLPAVYDTDLYGGGFMRPYYCYNGSRFIFSFPADEHIYSYDPEEPRHSLAYQGKSSMLISPIKPVQINELQTGEGASKAFLLRNSYGPIFYDPYKKRYLRTAEKAINKEELGAKNWNKEHSLIIFDEQFKIIGESAIDKSIDLQSLLITPAGLFARTDALKQDEDNIYFVKLDYLK